MKRAAILGTGRYLPEKVVTNFDLEKRVDTNNEWIVTRTGIEERRVAAEDEATSDMSAKAAMKAIEKAGLTPLDIDMIIVATVTPDMAFPSTACLVQDLIGAKNAAAFDVEAACSGFLYGLSMATAFISSEMYKNILVVGAETMSSIIDPNDRNTVILFGDGAGAAVVGQATGDEGILSTVLGADGEGGKYLTLPAGGSRKPASHETVDNKEHYVHMAGSDVFKFAVRIMGNASVEAVEKAGLSIEDVDVLVPHQANIRIISAAAKRLKLPMDKVKVNLNKYGNISAASIPIALDEAIEEGMVKKGDNVVLTGFGGGLTWGSTVIRF
ncbi:MULTISPECIES: beta-ketoacyl-ACP synthase III [unclassified Fusibacter]|uniref:beta-ketoacyl-ACP synthase III n=1 Tax=unclassified Fusibacter TaxID=2624464 RepID=UPI001011F90B|nr:beta-ketoacyl-ACP synthase III [Fusibacter sp. A1]MCK8058075.1 ketoacyl-ACP synthase III [Fusibacter sp. A2]NPE20657.1 ketoacyl-ACP synthase III [Fusibacter sp. A1]RXV62863.1 ketoacyl-ACP synthase III [Fusibacter sp. A1]